MPLPKGLRSGTSLPLMGIDNCPKVVARGVPMYSLPLMGIDNLGVPVEWRHMLRLITPHGDR